MSFIWPPSKVRKEVWAEISVRKTKATGLLESQESHGGPTKIDRGMQKQEPPLQQAP